MILLLIVVFTLLGSLVSVGLAGLVLCFPSRHLDGLTRYLIPYAIGTLLGAAFFGMIPQALHHLSTRTALGAILAGIILFFILEKLAIWRHCHQRRCDIHSQAGTLILIGDSLHNFVDGVAIAVAFATSVPLGITTSVAVIAHEVPQEVGDFAILLASGYTRRRAFLFNALSSLAALLGAVLAYVLLAPLRQFVPYLLALSAASFLYIALADLIPGRREVSGLHALAWELVLIVAGVGTIGLLQLTGQGHLH
jgi:zinc and cadmium transporter